ncbi:GTP 3',8-cyclase MoaA [Reichenbachiella carrageenanivorans]|uniref:GTP 3',8-cyclase n=1 Tax=Reichenbachiella carrageenanivorans TaxID=2979869 RepID=A0ABY6D2B2_9BACT|nr:GTP 3',8-cyclase MoaA [Reichenbachiella carrageenanivorans]UXX77975.1 GTP 3',8-cyclase MoaA [Reichenbachiella carrageenanivorans]
MTNLPINTLVDPWNRTIDYLRIAVTDRCNLRCFYCMPAEGINYLPKKELLTYEEIIRLAEIFASLGIKKIRLTGGEPFLRKDFISLLTNLKKIPGIEAVHITTNGVLTHQYLDQMQEIGIDGVNLSLDSLDKENFYKITRRDEFDTVMKTLGGLLDRGIDTKINMVVMHGKNTQEVVAMAGLARHRKVSVRFIEEMPFNGSAQSATQNNWSHVRILDELKQAFPMLTKLDSHPSNPATLYQEPSHLGNIGIIPAFSRTFCDACNRIRLTATGTIKNCLYDEGVLDVKALLRSDQTDDDIQQILIATVQKREKDGFAAEKNRTVDQNISESMSSIGG